MALLFYLVFAPEDEYYRCYGRGKQKLVQKIRSLILTALILAAGYALGEYWKTVSLCIVGLQGVTLVNLGKEMTR